jgi:hypothetical protein
MQATKVSCFRIQYPYNPEYFRSRLKIARCMQTLQKNEDTWCKISGHLRCRIKFNPESIQWAVEWKIFYTILRNPNGNRNILYFNRNDDGKWNWNYNWLDNQWNADNPSAGCANLFISLPLFFIGRVFLCQNTSTPASQISADFIQFFRKLNILFIIQGFCFPKNVEKNFQHIRFPDSQFYIGNFFFWFQKTGNNHSFNHLHKHSVYFLSKGEAMSSW